MELSGARVLLVGATGVLGGLLADRLHAAGCRLVVTGRDADRLLQVAGKVEAVKHLRLDVIDVDACAHTVEDAAARAGVGDIAQLDRIIAHQRHLAAIDDTRGFHEADEAFHELLCDIAGHPGIWRLLRTVKVQIDRARRLTLPILGRMTLVVGEHTTIRNAIAAHDAVAARAAMMHHLSAVIPDVAALRARFPAYFV